MLTNPCIEPFYCIFAGFLWAFIKALNSFWSLLWYQKVMSDFICFGKVVQLWHSSRVSPMKTSFINIVEQCCVIGELLTLQRSWDFDIIVLYHWWPFSKIQLLLEIVDKICFSSAFTALWTFLPKTLTWLRFTSKYSTDLVWIVPRKISINIFALWWTTWYYLQKW